MHRQQQSSFKTFFPSIQYFPSVLYNAMIKAIERYNYLFFHVKYDTLPVDVRETFNFQFYFVVCFKVVMAQVHQNVAIGRFPEVISMHGRRIPCKGMYTRTIKDLSQSNIDCTILT